MTQGFGTDIWCTDAVVAGRLARGKALVVQALYRRLITPRGTLRGGEEEAAYGLDLAAYVGAVGYATALAAIPGLVRGELLKDDRVADITVSVTESRDAAGLISLVLEIDGVLADEDEEFSLTMSVDDTTLTLLGGAS